MNAVVDRAEPRRVRHAGAHHGFARAEELAELDGARLAHAGDGLFGLVFEVGLEHGHHALIEAGDVGRHVAPDDVRAASRAVAGKIDCALCLQLAHLAFEPPETDSPNESLVFCEVLHALRALLEELLREPGQAPGAREAVLGIAREDIADEVGERAHARLVELVLHDFPRLVRRLVMSAWTWQ